jgi:hypothetical protein
MTQRFYFDTSVFGGIYDIEFEKETTFFLKKLLWGKLFAFIQI